MIRKDGIIESGSDEDLIRMWGLLNSSLSYVESEMYKRKMASNGKVKHDGKTLSIKFITEESEIEVDYK
jgi:hypothetical protein